MSAPTIGGAWDDVLVWRLVCVAADTAYPAITAYQQGEDLRTWPIPASYADLLMPTIYDFASSDHPEYVIAVLAWLAADGMVREWVSEGFTPEEAAGQLRETLARATLRAERGEADDDGDKAT